MPNATKMPPSAISPKPIFCVSKISSSNSLVFSSHFSIALWEVPLNSQSSPHSFPKVVNTNAPPMAIKVPPIIGLF